MQKEFDWRTHGFAEPPERRTAERSGLVMYRAWGGKSTEWGTGYFSLEKPESVLDAELRFNIADWGNEIHFLSTFKLKHGFEYFVGRVAHGSNDLSRPGHQVYVVGPLQPKIDLIESKKILRHDVAVVQRAGHA
jgi:hypothetical protein